MRECRGLMEMARSTVIRIYDEDTGELLQKSCSKCKEIKDVSEFGKYPRHSDGLKSNCKSCANGNTKKSHERKTPEGKERWKERLKHMSDEEVNQHLLNNMIRITKGDTVLIKRCYKCMEYKRIQELGMKKDQKDGIDNICLKCAGKRVKERYEANKEYILNQHKEYRQTPEGKAVHKRANHKRRTKKLGNGGNYTSDEWNQCLDYFNHCDAYTGEPLTTTEIEHIIPVSKGGTTYIYNIVPANKSTNCSKGKKDLWEWYSKQEYFSWERYIKICMWVIKNGGASKDINIKE